MYAEGLSSVARNRNSMAVQMPSNSSFGIKRKFEAPIPQAVEDDTPLVNLRKRAKEEFRCALCELIVGCEMDMEAHLNGRKHKKLFNSRDKAQDIKNIDIENISTPSPCPWN
ncbi:hypothetical protein Vadar_011230 [Vaccinium darrowii]|uniref:Uncharacterized protein n=1 Tax=Vaccinium darrowii TaxID=229202 RepID=A0ACB7ZAD6_9ERIC|nr:hypothetical protein Vadar_011230 [Vaccinium darrowii]